MRLNRSVGIILVACFLLALVAAKCSDERSDTAASIEEFKRLARPDTFRRYGPDTPEPEWEVYRKDGGIFVRQYEHSPAPNPEPAFAIYIISMDPESTKWHRVSDGWLRGWGKREFGGGIEWYSPDGDHHYELANENVRDFVQFQGQTYVLTEQEDFGLDDGGEGRVLRLVRDGDTGRWTAERFVTLLGIPCGFFIDDRGALMIATSAGLVEVWPDARMKLLVPWDRWGTLQPDIEIVGSDGRLDFNSFVMAQGGGTAYIGMPQAVIEITSLRAKPKLRYFIRNDPLPD